MRASWTDTQGRKIVVTDIENIRECWDDCIEFRSREQSSMKLFIDDEEIIKGGCFKESCRFIDSEIVLSADKE